MANLVPEGNIQIQRSASSGVTVIEHSAEVHVYQVPEDTLNRLAETGLGRNLNLVFAAALFGAVFSLFVVWLTIDVTDAIQAATVNAILIGLAVLFIFFAIQAFRDHKRSRRELGQIKGKQNHNVIAR